MNPKKAKPPKGEPISLDEKQLAELERDAKIASIVDPATGAALMLPWLLDRKPNADLIRPLQNQVANVVATGDSKAIETMLYAQALSLQALFNRWVSVAALCSDAESIDRIASLALRSQDQCRKTLLALAEIRNPKKPTQFIKNYVDKQLNQLRVEQDDSSESAPSFLEGNDSAPVDIGSSREAGRTDQDLEAVETEHRATD